MLWGQCKKLKKKSKNLKRETAKKWINLSVQAFHALGLHVNVIDLFMRHEHLGLSHPHTAILAAESAIYEKKYDVFYRIHSLWEEREEPHLWQLLKSQALIYKGLVENGMSLLTNTCFLDPKIEARRHALLSDGFLAIGDIQRAKESLHQSIQLDRKKAEYYRKKALLETREKNWEEAEKSLQEAIKVAPTVPQHYQNLANFYMRQGEYQKSAKI